MYISVPLENGEAFLVEAEPDGPGVVRAGRGDGLVASSAETFEQSLSRIRQIADSIVARFARTDGGPDRIRAEFGVNVSAEAGMVVAKGTGKAHFVLELEWNRGKDEATASAE